MPKYSQIFSRKYLKYFHRIQRKTNFIIKIDFKVCCKYNI